MELKRITEGTHKRFETETVWIWYNMLDIGTTSPANKYNSKSRFIISPIELKISEIINSDWIRQMYISKNNNTVKKVK